MVSLQEFGWSIYHVTDERTTKDHGRLCVKGEPEEESLFIHNQEFPVWELDVFDVTADILLQFFKGESVTILWGDSFQFPGCLDQGGLVEHG